MQNYMFKKINSLSVSLFLSLSVRISLLVSLPQCTLYYQVWWENEYIFIFPKFSTTQLYSFYNYVVEPLHEVFKHLGISGKPMGSNFPLCICIGLKKNSKRTFTIKVSPGWDLNPVKNPWSPERRDDPEYILTRVLVCVWFLWLHSWVLWRNGGWDQKKLTTLYH